MHGAIQSDALFNLKGKREKRKKKAFTQYKQSKLKSEKFQN